MDKGIFNLQEIMLPAPVNGGFRMEGYWVWCGSVAKGEDGNYHMFASRWPKALPMHPGWLLQSEIVRAVSKAPEGPFMYCETVMKGRGPEYWDGRMVHNPHITRQGDKWVLYYIGSTHPFTEVKPGEEITLMDPRVIVARSNKRIGVAVADRITGPWERFPEPVMTVRPDQEDNFFVSNPAPCVEEDGGVLMMYKFRSYKKDLFEATLHSDMKLNAARAKHYAGSYVRGEGKLFDDDVVLEDPYIWKEDGVYHMIAKDMHGNLCGERFGGVYARSENGEKWDIRRNYCAFSRKILWDDGKERLMGNLDRPFILWEDGKPRCIYFATSDGSNGFMDAKDTWNMAIPLRQ